MRTKSWNHRFGVAMLCIVLCACQKEDDKQPVYAPTALQVDYPQWVNIYLDEIPIPADNPLTEEGVALGRMLFYEKKLSADGTQSCATCHRQENAFSDPERFSKGIDGSLGTRNAMAIINLGWSEKMFWDGRRNTLEEQAHDPVVNPIEMKNENWVGVLQRLQNDSKYPKLFFEAFGTFQIDSSHVTKAIAQFERTLISFNSRFDRYYFEGDTTVFNEQEKRGLDVFLHSGECNHCHSDALLTDNFFRNNGLDEAPTDLGMGGITDGFAADNGKFKVTTLRNIAQTAPYMHDGRFATLEETVEHYNSGIKMNSPNIDESVPLADGGGDLLTAEQKADLLAFLQTLTDESFLNNPNFSDPN